jgi:DNA polymerase-3 subunit gamma/tau
MRDAISILERCCQESIDEIGVDIVKELVGIPSLEYISKITKNIFENNEIAALEVIDEVIDSGKDLNNFLWEVIKYIKDVLVYKSTGTAKLYSGDELSEIKAISELASRERILNTIYLLSDLENEIKWSSQKTIMFQTGIIKACMGTSVDGIDELRIKIENLENKLASGNFSNISVSNNKVKSSALNSGISDNVSNILGETGVVKNEKNLTSTQSKSKLVENNVSSGNSEINWNNVINTLRSSGKVRLYTSLANTKLNQVGDLILEIEFPNGLTPFVQGILEDSSNKKDLTDILFKETGKQWHIKYKDGKNSKPSNVPKDDGDSINKLGLDINVIE